MGWAVHMDMRRGVSGDVLYCFFNCYQVPLCLLGVLFVAVTLPRVHKWEFSN